MDCRVFLHVWLLGLILERFRINLQLFLPEFVPLLQEVQHFLPLPSLVDRGLPLDLLLVASGH